MLFVYNTIGYYAAFKILQIQIRSEAKEQIEKSLNEQDLIKIVLPAEKTDELKWTRAGKEFIYKDKMFDVIKKKEEKGTTTFYCINDEKEETLFSNLDEYVRKNTDRNNKLKNLLTKIITNYFIEDIKIPEFTREEVSLTTAYQTNYKSSYNEIKSPPPKTS